MDEPNADATARHQAHTRSSAELTLCGTAVTPRLPPSSTLWLTDREFREGQTTQAPLFLRQSGGQRLRAALTRQICQGWSLKSHVLGECNSDHY